MVQKDSKVLVPPRLLAGVVVLYWGAMVGMPLVGLVLAILLEARNWIDYRWDIGEKGYVKSFYVTLFFIAVALVIIRLDDVDITSFSKIIRWSPIFGLPIELAQRYGKSDRMYLNTFFYFSRRRMIQDRREGRPVHPNVINTGYPYIIGVLISATCTDRHDWLVSVGMLVIVMAILFFVAYSRGMRWQRMIWLFPVILGIAFIGQSIIQGNYEKIVKFRTGSGNYSSQNSYDAYSTRLGGLGAIKQSSDIQWRIWADESPQYVHTGIYNKYVRTSWRYDYKSEGFDTFSQAFEKRAGNREINSEDNAYVFEESQLEKLNQARSASDLSQVTIRGVGDTQTTESVVPAVAGFKVISGIASSDTLPTMNSMGVIRLVDRKVVIDYKLWQTEVLESQVEPPNSELDLQVAREYRNTVELLVNEIQLDKFATTEEKVSAIRNFFNTKFEYALHFDVDDGNYHGNDLEWFMLHGRKGHCEYFATTAALMLRKVGVPTRYVVGYVVREKDGDEWVVRGTHGHAWCSVWIDGAWRTVDLTPASWLAMENVDKDLGMWQQITDSFQRIREDFQVWKSQPGNDGVFNWILTAIGALLLLWFGWRIWHKRIKEKEQDFLNLGDFEWSHEMNRFISDWEQQFGEKPKGKTLRSWILCNVDQFSDDKRKLLELVISLHEQFRFKKDDKSGKQLLVRLNEWDT